VTGCPSECVSDRAAVPRIGAYISSGVGFRWKAAAFSGWHEPYDGRLSRTDL
jgi:hypothetical protein